MTMSPQLLLRKLVNAAATMLGASFVLFLLLMSGPDPLATLAQESEGVDTAALAHSYGWDRPWYVQYGDWLSHLARFDFGTSIRTHEPAGSMILERLPITITLGLASTLVSVAVSILLALWAAQRRNESGDRLVTGAMVALGALPGFLIALVLQRCAVALKDVLGFTVVYVGGMPRDGGILEYAQRFALPVLVLAMVQVAVWMRFQRSELIEALDSDMVVAARGRGIPRQRILLQHALRHSLAPIVTLVAMELGTLVGGTLIVETVFSLPGLGRLLVDSLQAHDIVVSLDIVMLGAAAIVIASACADLLAARIDPRIGAQ